MFFLSLQTVCLSEQVPPHFDLITKPPAGVVAFLGICSVKYGSKVLSWTVSHSDLIADNYDFFFFYIGCESVFVIYVGIGT